MWSDCTDGASRKDRCMCNRILFSFFTFDPMSPPNEFWLASDDRTRNDRSSAVPGSDSRLHRFWYEYTKVWNISLSLGW